MGHGRFYEDREIDSRGYECASHDIHAAPGYHLVVEGLFDGRLQRIAIDPDEVDEFARRLHQAKRYARREVAS